MRHLILIAIISIAALTTHAQTAHYDDRPKISVSGDAVVYVRPDKITITFGIETNDMDILKAKAENTRLVTSTVVAMQKMGIPKNEIQTDHLSVEPRYENHYKKREFLGFFVRNTLVVTTTDPENVEALVTKALTLGVTHIDGLSFQTTELRKHRDRAREMALLAAKEKADDMARVLGQIVGAPISISEGSSGHYGYFGWGGNRSFNVAQNAQQSISGNAPTDGVALGKIAIRATIHVSFELTR